MKIKNILLISVVVLGIFILSECQNLWINGSLIATNITKDTRWYRGDVDGTMRYNETIWLSRQGQYAEAKSLLTPILNDINFSKRAEVAELYGDLMYSMSGNIEEVIHMYEHSLSFAPSDRILSKIAYIQNSKQISTASGKTEKNTTNTGSSLSGSSEIEAKKLELQKIGEQRKEYLRSSTISASESKNTLERLMESVQSESVGLVQDW